MRFTFDMPKACCHQKVFHSIHLDPACGAASGYGLRLRILALISPAVIGRYAFVVIPMCSTLVIVGGLTKINQFHSREAHEAPQFWVLVKELSLTYHNKETIILFTVDLYYGN